MLISPNKLHVIRNDMEAEIHGNETKITVT